MRITTPLVGIGLGAVLVLHGGRLPIPAHVVPLLVLAVGFGAAIVRAARQYQQTEEERHARRVAARPAIIRNAPIVLGAAVLGAAGMNLLPGWGVPDDAQTVWLPTVVGLALLAAAAVHRSGGFALAGAWLIATCGGALAAITTMTINWGLTLGTEIAGTGLIIGCLATIAWRARDTSTAAPRA